MAKDSSTSAKKATKKPEESKEKDVDDTLHVGSYNSFKKANNPSALAQAIGPAGSFEFEFELVVGNKVEQLLGQSDPETEE